MRCEVCAVCVVFENGRAMNSMNYESCSYNFSCWFVHSLCRMVAVVMSMYAHQMPLALAATLALALVVQDHSHRHRPLYRVMTTLVLPLTRTLMTCSNTPLL